MNMFASISQHIYSHNSDILTEKLYLAKMFLFVCALLIKFSGDCYCISNEILDKLPEQYPGFGTEWVWFQDENGVSHKITIKPLQNETDTKSMKMLDFRETNYWLYTRANPNKTEISINDDSLEKSTFDPSKDIKIITHGYFSSGNADTCQSIKDNFLKVYDANVFIFDWGTLAKGLYTTVAFYPKQIGMFNADFIDSLVKKGADPARIHVVGHSLGAHLSGFTGKYAKQSGITVGRITGLDPAGFLFFTSSSDDRLDASDAEFVDVIHSCGPSFGIYKAIGHANFYPNGGTPIQPGCDSIIEIIHTCSHGRSWKYFAESIITEVPFVGYKCTSYDDFKNGSPDCTEAATMGDRVPKTAKGEYYLDTKAEAPFALGPNPKFPKLSVIS